MDKLTIRQGKTFEKTFRWGAAPLIYVPITAAANTAPVRITAPGHNLPPKWPVALMGLGGLTELNARNNPPKAGDFRQASTVDGDILTINTVNAERFARYTSGGQLVYYTPVPLDDYTARFVVRDKVGGTVLFEGDTQDGTVFLDVVAYTIKLSIDAVTTAGFVWKRGVCELELTDGNGYVPSAFPISEIEVVREVAA